MGPKEHGGHCELRFDGLRVPDADRLMNVGDGLKVTQIRLGTARLTHCMRWLGMARRALEIARPYVAERQSFGVPLAEHEGVQWLLGEAAMAIEVRSEEHTSELQSLMRISYAVFCLKKKKATN